MTRVVKCVVWDLDNTIWPGIAIERQPDVLPQPTASILDIIRELEKRGIASSVASRNDPALGKQLLAHPKLAGRFVYPQISWEPKSQAVSRIAEKLNIGLDAVVFVDDSPFERAEVSYMLPQVTVLDPSQVAAAVEGPAFNASHTTAEGETRVQKYREEEQRRAAEE